MRRSANNRNGNESASPGRALRVRHPALLLCLGLGCAQADPLFRDSFEHPPYALNDSGVVFCGVAVDGNNDPCTGSEPQGQDRHHGRDARALAGTLVKVGAGDAGFDFGKIGNAGQALPAGTTLGTGANDWACTRDHTTGLLWEVKLNQPGHLRYQGHTYSWYDPDSGDGNPGSVGDTTTCADTLAGQACNTRNFRDAVNAAGLCGHNDWRLPRLGELFGLVNFQRLNPSIDTSYFPNTPSLYFWSVDPAAGAASTAWSVHFDQGGASPNLRSQVFRVRLVRGP